MATTRSRSWRSLFVQILLLQQKDGKLLWRRKLSVLLEFSLALLSLPVTILLVKTGSYKYPLKYEVGYAYNESIDISNGASEQIIVTGNVSQTDYERLRDLGRGMNWTLELRTSTYNFTNQDQIMIVHSLDMPTGRLDYRQQRNYVRTPYKWLSNDAYLPWLQSPLEFKLDRRDYHYFRSQFAFEAIFLRAAGLPTPAGPLPTRINLAVLPCPDFLDSGVLTSYPYSYILLVVVSLLPAIFVVRDVLAEHVAGIRTYMQTMGLSPTAYYVSHLLSATLKISIVMIACYIPLFFALKSTWYHTLVLISLYANCTAAFTLLLTTAIRRTVPASIIITVVNIVLAAVAIAAPPDRTNLLTSALHSLNPVGALSLGFDSLLLYQRMQRGVAFFGVFPTMWTWELSVAMLVVEWAVLILAGLYLDAVIPVNGVARMHWLGCMARLLRRKDVIYAVNGNVESPVESGSIKTDEGMRGYLECAIDIRRLVKQWPNGEVAVNGLNLKAYKGNVTVLLGHNGAGKSTTFGCLTGSAQPTSGDAYLGGLSLQHQLAECQQLIGYCPQENPLFGRLTVREHLLLYGRMRAGRWGGTDAGEVDRIATRVGLAEKRDELAGDLSGGMKRKLCVAMALIGNTRVVLMDEPTAGMDPTARQQIRELLMAEKKERAILYSTHYMDEAEALGDRVAILVGGRLVCCGSPDFLRRRYGTGYVLTIEIERAAPERDRLPRLIQSLVGETIRNVALVESSVSQEQFSLLLPFEERHKLTTMFQALEEHKQPLGLGSMGLSLNSLEQVFIKVNEVDAGGEQASPVVPQPANAEKVKGVRLVLAQFLALLWRHALYYWRNKARLVAPLAICVVLFLPFLTGLLSHLSDIALQQESVDHPLVFDEADKFPHCTMLVGNVPMSTKTKDSLARFPLMELKEVDMSDVEAVTDLYFIQPPPCLGLDLSNASEPKMFFSNRLGYGGAQAINLLSNLWREGNDRAIRNGFEVRPTAIADVINGGVSQLGSFEPIVTFKAIVLAAVFSLHLSVLVSVLVINVVAERATNFKHQLLLTGLRPGVYWLTQLVSDGLVYAVGIGFMFALVLLSDMLGITSGCIAAGWPIFAIYFFAAQGVTYCFSSRFRSTTKAFAFIFCWHTLIQIVVMMVVQGAVFVAVLKLGNGDLNNTFTTIKYVNALLGLIFPSSQANTGIRKVMTTCSMLKIRQTPYSLLDLYAFDDKSAGWELALLAAGAVFFFALLFLFQSRRVNAAVHSLLAQRYGALINSSHPSANENDDVKREREWMRQQPDSHLALAIRSLFKFYRRDACAVRDVTFGLRADECFGLLGVNGAGKTTIFNIVTSTLHSTSGSVAVAGVGVNETESRLGYCPQFDALHPDLTARETLRLAAHLNGLINVPSQVDRILDGVKMTTSASKLVQHCSGGQKRRISLAMALISGAQLILLDEPTAGIDPATRRQVWDLLIGLRGRGTAILLTTHSMEECEKLCTRIGFLNRGQLVSIGPSQHLKSRYGGFYQLSISMVQPSYEVGRYLNEAVCREFSCHTTTDPLHSATLTWRIHRRQGMNDRWSEMYSAVEEFVGRYNESGGAVVLGDFSLVDCGLDQVFRHFAMSTSP